MTRKIVVHILTPPMRTQNVRGFLTPIILNTNLFREIGIHFRYFTKNSAQVSECDFLFINAKFYGKIWNSNPGIILESLSNYRQGGPVIFYCDNYDSTAPIRTEVLPLIDVYFKNMVLRDRKLYRKEFYGGRIHTDYYHRNNKIEDTSPLYSKSIVSTEYLEKIKVSWNYGLAHYGFIGSRIARLYGRIPITTLLKTPYHFRRPAKERPIDVFCRISASHARETVAWHRKLMLEKLNKYTAVGHIDSLGYLLEIMRSKIVVSPFGWGEFSLRDFETFIHGGILFKPDMSHLETYPDFYQPNKTFVPFAWDLSDLQEKLDLTIANYKQKQNIAKYAQDLYRYYLLSNKSHEEFCTRLSNIMQSAVHNRHI